MKPLARVGFPTRHAPFAFERAGLNAARRAGSGAPIRRSMLAMEEICPHREAA
jgi:hypothetical protein